LPESWKPYFNLEGQLHITIIALYDDEVAETLLNAALYQLEQGRNNYQLYTSTMNSKASELLLLEIACTMLSNEENLWFTR